MSSRCRIWFGLPIVAVLLAYAAPDAKKAVIVESVSANSAGEKAGLKPGDVILRWTRDEAKGEIESPFDFLQIEIEQKPRGNVVAEGLRGTEKQSWTLGADAWGVQTRPDLQESALSVYRKCQALSDATPSSAEQCPPETATEDPAWFKSWFALQAAEALARARQWQLSDKAYEEAVRFGGQAGPAIAAQLLYRWATACESRGDLENAEKHYQESLLEYQKLNSESLAIAADLNGLSSAARKRGELEKAEDNSRRALAVAEKLAPGSLDVALSLNNLGNIAWAHRDLATADQYHRRALDIRQKLAPGSLAVAGSLNNLGLIAWQRDELDRAQDYQLQALGIRTKLAPGSLDLASSFNNLGGIAWNRGDLAKAENYYRQAFAIREALAPESLDLAINLYNLGLVARQRGELQGAERYYRQALFIEQKRKAQTLESANTLHNLADVLWASGRRSEAEEFDRKALQAREKLAPGSLDVAASLNNLGFSARERGKLTEAESYERRALAIEDDLAPTGLQAAVTLQQMGDITQARGQLATAEKFYRQALSIRAQLTPGSAKHAGTLASLARVLRRSGKLVEAADLFEQALQALESQTARLGGTEEARSVFRARHADYYSEYIDVLFQQHWYAQAFHVAERSRAQSFMEMLSVARVNVDKGIDPALLARKRHLEQAISSKSSDRIALFNGKHAQQQEIVLNQEIEKLLDEHQQLEDQIRSSAPEYADLTHPRSLTVKQVQDELLDPDSVLLEYSLGEQHSHLWIVAQTSLSAYDLPGRRIIEDAARQVHKLLIAPPAQSSTELHQQQARWNLAAARLSRLVLSPVAAQLGEKRLLIVTDGALQYIPFEALPLPSTSSAPLVVKHEMVYLPSASTLDALRRVHKTKEPGSSTVAVLADPVFDKDDARVRLKPVAQNLTAPQSLGEGEDLAISTEQLTRSVAESGLGRLPRLPYSRREADAILANIPPGQGAEFLDFDASRNTATSTKLAHFRIIHFATHGLLNSKHPELSGLVLSLVDQQGNSQNGFLGLQDIYNLNLRADLVVLSACETALGKDVPGEGLIGMTRGFMYSGANRVLASLWKVDDVATAELMALFYRSMEQAEMRPAAALRQAQIEMWKRKRWISPYYWAGFQLQGEWR